MIVQMSYQLLLRIELTAAKQLFDALNDWTGFFAGRSIRHWSGIASLKREQHKADLIVRERYCCRFFPVHTEEIQRIPPNIR